MRNRIKDEERVHFNDDKFLLRDLLETREEEFSDSAYNDIEFPRDLLPRWRS